MSTHLFRFIIANSTIYWIKSRWVGIAVFCNFFSFLQQELWSILVNTIVAKGKNSYLLDDSGRNSNFWYILFWSLNLIKFWFVTCGTCANRLFGAFFLVSRTNIFNSKIRPFAGGLLKQSSNKLTSW